MVTVLRPASLWQQICSFFFLCSGAFNDLLVIRVALTLANLFLLVSGSLGHLKWSQSFTPQGRIAVDTVVWAGLNFLIHGLSVVRIFYDERKIELTEEQEALWRYIYRHSGLSKVQFHRLLCPHVELVEFRKGDPIAVTGKFFIVLDGVVAADANQVGTMKKHSIPITSGEMFPLQYMCIDYMPQENIFLNTWITPVAATDVKMYCIPSERLKGLSKDRQARDAWMALLIATLAVIAERPYYDSRNPLAFVLDEENAIRFSKRNSLFDPLEPSEEPSPLLAGSTHVLGRPLAHLWECCKLSVFAPWPMGSWPVGIRHKLPPPTDPKAESAIKRRTEDIRLRSHQLKTTGESPVDTFNNTINDDSGELLTVDTASRGSGNLYEIP